MIVQRNRRTQRSGAAVIEFAVCAPLLFLLILGLFEVGRYINAGEIATAASRFGAREATVAGANVASVTSRTQTYLQSSGIKPSAATITIESEAVAGSNSFGATSNLSAVPVGAAIRIRVNLQFSQVTWLPNGFFNGILPQTIPGVTVMRKEST